MASVKPHCSKLECLVRIPAVASLLWISVVCSAFPQRSFIHPDSVDHAHAGLTDEASVTVRHEIVKRGDHQHELHAAEYVIVGSFKLQANAQRFSKGLHNLNFKTQLGYLTATELWYVYIVKTNQINKARAEQQRISKLFLLRDAWLLTVEP